MRTTNQLLTRPMNGTAVHNIDMQGRCNDTHAVEIFMLKKREAVPTLAVCRFLKQHVLLCKTTQEDVPQDQKGALLKPTLKLHTSIFPHQTLRLCVDKLLRFHGPVSVHPSSHPSIPNPNPKYDACKAFSALLYTRLPIFKGKKQLPP